MKDSVVTVLGFHLVISIHRGPPTDSKNTIMLTTGSPQDGTLFFGTPQPPNSSVAVDVSLSSNCCCPRSASRQGHI